MEPCDGIAIIAILSILLNAVFAAKCCMRKIRNPDQEKSQDSASPSFGIRYHTNLFNENDGTYSTL
jgi:hypothetical protein